MQEEQEEEKLWRNISKTKKKLVLSFILKRKKMKKRERKISYLKRMKKYLCTRKKNEKRCYMLCAHQINGRTMAADHSIAVKSRHQSLHVFIISKLQFTIYIIKKRKSTQQQHLQRHRCLSQEHKRTQHDTVEKN